MEDHHDYQYFGISLDEAGRAQRAKKRFADMPWARLVYPLLELGWTRKDCVAWLHERTPSRSSVRLLVLPLSYKPGMVRVAS